MCDIFNFSVAICDDYLNSQNSSIIINMESKNIKNRLFQTLQNRSPKNHPFLLKDQTTEHISLRPKKLQDLSSPSNAKPTPTYKHGKLILNPFTSPEVIKKRPQEVEQEKLSKEAKSIVQQTKNRIRNNLKPHDIFQLYDNFPQMMEDFFYLNRMQHPYDYQIVTYAQRDPSEYMTISSQGVTLYHDKEAQFMTKEEWCIDEKRYYALQKIYFFKQYKLSKNFRIWKNKMRRHYIREMERILKQNLFLAIKYPRDCLLEIKYQTNNLRDSLNFFPFQSMQKLTPQGFTQLLDEYRQKTLLKGIKQTTQNITKQLQLAVIEQINKFKQENNIKIEGVNQKHNGNKQGFVYSQEAILKKQYKRVYKLIKLADSMLQQAKIQMVFRCLQQLVQKIRELQYEDKQPWISCTATIYQNGSISWYPNCQSLTNLFLQAIKKHIKLINQNNEKIINNPIFNKYRFADCTESKAEELESKNSFKMFIQQSPNYSVLLKQIQQTLESQFNNTTKEQQVLQKFIQIYTRHKQLANMSNIFKENNGVQLCNSVQQWKKQDRIMNQLSEEKRGKLLLYNYNELRKNIVNIPKQTLSCFFSLLPEQTSIRCKEIITQSKNLLQSISLYPTEIVSFARFNKAVKMAAQRLEDIRSSGSQICLLVDLLGKNKLANIDIYNAKKIQVLNSISNLKSKVEQSEAKENQSLSKFKKDNQGEISKIKANVKDLATRFNAIDFQQVKATARQMKEILLKIKQILPAVSNLENQSLKITEIQAELNLPQTDFNEVHQLYTNVKLVNDIWACRQEWKNLLLSLYHKHYCDVDCEDIKRKWEEFNLQATNLTKILPQNQTLKNIGQQLNQVQVLIDTISALRSPNLQEKSWREISQYLAYEMGIQNQADFPFSNFKNPTYTVKWLLQINIPIYKQKIEFIVRKSEKQRELSTHLTEYKNYIVGGINFQTIQKRNEFYIFAQNKQITSKIHQNLTHLFAMLDNQYSPSIRNEAETLIKHYEYVQEIMKAVFQFGYLWQKYQNFFDSNSSSIKLLTKESKEFAGWQTQWKKIIKNITDTPTFYRKIYDETVGNNPSRATLKLIGKTNVAIQQVRKGLEEYLQRKRSNFPRYYFIPDQKLLNMLANIDSKEPITASFVPIIYRNIKQILYKQETKDTLLGIISKDGQEFSLKNINFKVQSQMQDIFKLTEEQIKKRIAYLIKNMFVKYSDEEVSRQNMILENNMQVVLAVDSIAWVRLAEETYLCSEPIGDLYDWIEIQQDQIQELKDIIKKPQTSVIKHKLLQLLCQSLYFAQKTEYLLKSNITSTESYEWQRIPKITMANNNSDIFLRHFNSKLNYCYQFLGNSNISYIQPETQRVWIHVIQAIVAREVVCLQNSLANNHQTIKQLGCLIAQEVQSINLGQRSNFKMIQRYINGSLYTGYWTIFNAPSTQKMLVFLANQLNNVKKILLDTSVQKVKGSLNCNPNVAFFLAHIGQNNQQLTQLVSPIVYRNVNIVTPSWSKVCGIIAENKGKQPQLSNKIVSICEVMKECFENSYCQIFSFKFVQSVLLRVIDQLPAYQWLKSIKCKQIYEYVTFQILDEKLLPLLRKDDCKVYEALKTSIVPDYEKIRIRHPSNRKDPLLIEITRFIEKEYNYNKKNTEYLQTLELFVKAATSHHVGIILSGKPLSGKSQLIKVAASFIQNQTNDKVHINKVYNKAYNNKDYFSFEKNSYLLNESQGQSKSRSWIVIDGVISEQYLQLMGRNAQKYLMPQVGVTGSSQKYKFISQTYDTSMLTPQIVANHSIIWIGESLTTQQIVRKLFTSLSLKGYLSNLHCQAVQWLTSSLIMNLNKLQNKSILKSKSINFLYSLNNLQISYRCCKLVEAIFIMNWESIKDKEKNMKKIIDRFVPWALYWCLIGLVFVEDQMKLEKCIMEIAKTQSNYSEQLGNCIIYSNCGLQVQPLNGLRTQSSMGIPQKGIITNLLRTDLLPQSETTKNNKFFEQIVISEAQLIRVNYYQSNKFNYLWQLAQYTSTAMLVVGPQNSGKKSIVELLAKNMRSKTQFYSIRYKNRQQLSTKIEKPFRKLNGLQGTVLKSLSASKKLLISIEDVSLDSHNFQTCQLLRMIFNQKGYYNKMGQWVAISDSSFCLIAKSIAYNTKQLRLYSRLNVFQTANNTQQKLHAIYYPYLKNWAAFNGLSGDVERIFGSEAGDTLLDAILSIYKLFQDMYKSSPQTNSIERLLLKPRIGDISKVIGYICRTPMASHYNMSYYYELWVHQVVRVFGDRLQTERNKEVFFKQIKKQALVKFKQNFNLNQETMFTFTSLGVQNENCYIRIQDPAYLHNYISNLLQAEEITLPLKFLFDQLLDYLLKIYRVIALEGAHLLLIGHNLATTEYLIQLACQVSQNDYYKLNKELISVEKHIEPTLYFKQAVCLNESIQNLTEQAIYQIACLLNGNLYDFGVRGEMKEKIKSNLNKKQKIQLQKKETKSFGKTKTQLMKIEQKEEDIDILMNEQFMSFVHFVFQASPNSPSLRTFLKEQSGIVGKLHFSWIDIPTSSLVRVSKQILSFDQETNDLASQNTCNDKIIDKVKKIYEIHDKKSLYFNEFLAICDIVKIQSLKLGQEYQKRQKDLHQGKENMRKVQNSISQKQEIIKSIHEELQETNTSIEFKAKELEQITNKINEWQINNSNQETSNQNLVQLKMERDEKEIDLKILREKKDKLEPEKKKILKNIKIAEDYLELFNNSSEYFDKSIEQMSSKSLDLEDKLILLWSAVFYLNKIPISEWISHLNSWIEVLSSSLTPFTDVDQILELFTQFTPQVFFRFDFFSSDLKIKLMSIFMILHFYEQTSFLGKILRIYDPKCLLNLALQKMTGEQNKNYSLIKSYQHYNKDCKVQIESLLRSKPGLVVIEKNELIDKLQVHLIDKKMANYFNKIIVLSQESQADINLQCSINQLSYVVEDLTLKLVNPGMQIQRNQFVDELVKEVYKRRENEILLFKACASINIESETYIQQVSKYKNALNSAQEAINNLNKQLQYKKYAQLSEFQVIKSLFSVLQKVWSFDKVTFKTYNSIYQQAIYIRYSTDYEHLSIEQKQQILSNIVRINMGDISISNLKEQVTYSRRSLNNSKILVLKQSRELLESLQKKYRLINLLVTHNHSITTQHNNFSGKIYYNFIPQIHTNYIIELLQKQKVQKEDNNSSYVPIILMADINQIRKAVGNKVIVVQLEDQHEPSLQQSKLFVEARVLANIHKYLANINNKITIDPTVLEYLQKNDTSNNKETNVLRYISQLTSIDSLDLIRFLWRAGSEQIDKALQTMVNVIKNEEEISRPRQNTIHNKIQSPNYKDELPFSFNVSEFLPSKDILAAEIITQCIQFNQKLKTIKEQLKVPQYDWDACENIREQITPQMTASLNFEYQNLKKNLVKMHLISINSLSNTSKSAVSSHSLSNPNIIFQNVLSFPNEIIGPRLLNLLKCRAAKKLKTNFFSISIVWKLSTAAFNFEDVYSSPDLSMITQSRIIDDFTVLSGEMEKNEQEKGQVELMICPVDSAHLSKSTTNIVSIPVWSKMYGRIGLLQVNKSDVNMQNILGVSQVRLQLE